MLNSTATGFWGKYLSETGETLSLLSHALDVAVVFRALCDLDAISRTLANSTEVSLTGEHLDRLAVLAMLHDIGKANLGFQDKVLPDHPTSVGHIQELAPLFSDEKLNGLFFESLPRGITTWFFSPDSADSYFFAIFSHHGRPKRFLDSKMGSYRQARDRWWRPDSNRDPIGAIAEISSFAEKAFPRAFLTSTGPLPDEPRFHHRFAGLVMLADWLGSHNQWFPVQRTAAEKRLLHNRKVGPQLLKAIGLDVEHLRPILKNMGRGFESQFEFSPLPLQKMVNELNPHNMDNRLLIAESETGSGKTEAALNWFCKLFIAGKVDSLYFALPTRVAARELYERIKEYMQTWFPDSDCRPVTLLAVPGYAQIDGYSVKELIPDEKEANLWQENLETLSLERFWSGARPKRFLAATVAVGTIDQALLSTVQTAHAHLRSVCLDRSLLVVDEVHASDLYMSRLLRFLLAHHQGVGGYSILLSATLGARALNEYIQITRPDTILPAFPTAVKAPYPSLTLANGQMTAAASSKGAKKVQFDLREWAFCPEKTVDEILIPALKTGARVLVVMNTVARAIHMLRAIEAGRFAEDAWLFRCADQICPHHGRFAAADRQTLDLAVSTRLGMGSPPGPVILIGTQTLEQSLNIDADLLVTDLAPSDVLLQRVGRLHRHDRLRPAGYTQPRCIVLIPDQPFEEALGGRGEVAGSFKRLGFGSVYEDLRSLELTCRALKEHPLIVVPDDNRLLVEKATHPEALESLTGTRWREHGQMLYGTGLAKKITAGAIAIPFDQYFGKFDFAEFGRAVSTRLGIDQLHLPLDQKVLSPFGNTLDEIVIPGHMAPKEISDESITVEQAADEAINLRCKERRYKYSRYGLEEI